MLKNVNGGYNLIFFINFANMEINNKLAFLKQEAPTLQALVKVALPNIENAEAYVQAEILNLMAIAETKPEILECTPASIFTVIRQSINDCMSLNPMDGMAYITTRNVPLEKDNQGNVTKWAKVLEVAKTARCWVSYARQCGVLLDIITPEVYFDEKGNVESIEIEMLLNSYPEPRWQSRTFTAYNFKKWMAASAKQNKGTANALYTANNGTPDIDFLCTKCIKHAVKALALNKREVPKSITNFIPEKIEDIVPVKSAIIESQNDEGGLPI